ncbi:translation initiation factor IF-2-like isoform X1 [Canis lupus familiaris]|uniref:translation initiation factor IF-2-like isoform X1 n=1 Tax=Canis lupus familiaris TaxID=9615 RepID=UPI0018F43699|nr:translation initiation factor IF-2-like isoform X1 [Canis lupus familiaris]
MSYGENIKIFVRAIKISKDKVKSNFIQENRNGWLLPLLIISLPVQWQVIGYSLPHKSEPLNSATEPPETPARAGKRDANLPKPVHQGLTGRAALRGQTGKSSGSCTAAGARRHSGRRRHVKSSRVADAPTAHLQLPRPFSPGVEEAASPGPVLRSASEPRSSQNPPGPPRSDGARPRTQTHAPRAARTRLRERPRPAPPRPWRGRARGAPLPEDRGPRTRRQRAASGAPARSPRPRCRAGGPAVLGCAAFTERRTASKCGGLRN